MDYLRETLQALLSIVERERDAQREASASHETFPTRLYSNLTL